MYKPEVAKFSLVIRDVGEVIQDEADGKLPAHLTREFRSREEAWAEYKREVEDKFWQSTFMWEVTVCVLDSKAATEPKYVIFAHFNHGATDGAAAMEALSEFVRVLSAGLTSRQSLPPHNFLGESLPVPKPFLERYPLFKFDDPASDDEKEELFAKVIAKLSTEEGRVHNAIADRMFTEEATRRFIAKCKRSGVSVTAGLFAAVAMAAGARKFDPIMPLSYRTKDNWGELAASFTDASFSLDFTRVLEEEEGNGEEAVWVAMAREFHREIRKKLSSPEEMYRGLSLTFARSALEEFKVSDAICTGPNGDEFSMGLSNVGIMDGYFPEKDSPLCVSEVAGFCSNPYSLGIAFWCYTFRGKFRMCLADSIYGPKRRAFEDFAEKVFKIVEEI